MPSRPSRRARPFLVAGLSAFLVLLGAGGLDAAERLFGPDGPQCYMRRYDGDHLARHPTQEVTAIWLGRTARSARDPDEAAIGFGFSLHGDVYESLAYCRGDTCDLEGDAGSFSLSPDGEAVRLTVGEHLSIEGPMDFSPDLARSPDDRVFRLFPASRRACG